MFSPKNVKIVHWDKASVNNMTSGGENIWSLENVTDFKNEDYPCLFAHVCLNTCAPREKKNKGKTKLTKTTGENQKMKQAKKNRSNCCQKR